MTQPPPPSHEDMARAEFLGVEAVPWSYSPCQPGCPACIDESGDWDLIYPEQVADPHEKD